MDQASTVQATIKGSVSGQVAVGNYILQMGDVNGGIVNFAPPSDRPAYSMRPSPVNLRPRAFPSFLDRDDEFASVKTALQNATPVSIYGEEGIGKSSFFRQLAYLPEIEAFNDGVVCLDAPGRRRDDLLQSLFDAFYESVPQFKPTDVEIHRALQGLKALILLDNLNLQRDEVISLLDAAPSGTFVLLSIERIMYQAKALNAIGFLNFGHGDNIGSLRAFEDSARLLRQIGEKRMLAQGLAYSGMAGAFLGNRELAYATVEEAITLAREVGDKVTLGIALSNMAGVIAMTQVILKECALMRKKAFDCSGKAEAIGRLR